MSDKDSYDASFRVGQSIEASSEEEAKSRLRQMIHNFEDDAGNKHLKLMDDSGRVYKTD